MVFNWRGRLRAWGKTQLSRQAAAPVALGDGARVGPPAHPATAEERRSIQGERGCRAHPNTPHNSRGKAGVFLATPLSFEEFTFPSCSGEPHPYFPDKWEQFFSHL